MTTGPDWTSPLNVGFVRAYATGLHDLGMIVTAERDRIINMAELKHSMATERSASKRKTA